MDTTYNMKLAIFTFYAPGLGGLIVTGKHTFLPEPYQVSLYTCMRLVNFTYMRFTLICEILIETTPLSTRIYSVSRKRPKEVL